MPPLAPKAVAWRRGRSMLKVPWRGNWSWWGSTSEARQALDGESALLKALLWLSEASEPPLILLLVCRRPWEKLLLESQVWPWEAKTGRAKRNLELPEDDLGEPRSTCPRQSLRPQATAEREERICLVGFRQKSQRKPTKIFYWLFRFLLAKSLFLPIEMCFANSGLNQLEGYISPPWVDAEFRDGESGDKHTQDEAWS